VNRLTIGSALGALLAASACAPLKETAMTSEPNTLYIAPGGSDANPGTRAMPLATLERARDAVREMKALDALPVGGITVELAAGVYERPGAFELTGKDTGTRTCPVVYRAREGTEVRLVGGRTVSGWRATTTEAVLERLAPEARGKVLEAGRWASATTAG